MTTPKDILDSIKKNDIEFVDFKFIDLLGTWQHLQVPIGVVNESTLEEGVMFDGSSIRCWQTIDASDMKMIPDLSTMKMDGFFFPNYSQKGKYLFLRPPRWMFYNVGDPK